jgi:hypothetical protein
VPPIPRRPRAFPSALVPTHGRMLAEGLVRLSPAPCAVFDGHLGQAAALAMPAWQICCRSLWAGARTEDTVTTRIEDGGRFLERWRCGGLAIVG